MIGSVRNRRDIARIVNSGVKARLGPLRIAYLAGSSDPAVAFAVPKAIGTAVARNRARRRLRAVLNELATEDSGLLHSGDYLIRVTAPLNQVSYGELRLIVTGLLRALRV